MLVNLMIVWFRARNFGRSRSEVYLTILIGCVCMNVRKVILYPILGGLLGVIVLFVLNGFEFELPPSIGIFTGLVIGQLIVLGLRSRQRGK